MNPGKNLAALLFVTATWLAAAPALAAQNSGAQDLGDLSGVWWSTVPTPALHPMDGSPVPLTPKGAGTYENNKKLIKTIESALPTIGNLQRCIPDGVPRVWGAGYPFQIINAQNQIVIAYERYHSRRMIYMNDVFDADAEPAYLGNSVGKWDGDTLVIESSTYKAHPTHSFLDSSGLPHTDKLKVTERIRRIGDGKTLEVLATIADPEIYSKPWTVRFTFARRPDTHIQEYICSVGMIQTRLGKEGDFPPPRP